jgi:acid phosphatase type 7
VPQKPNRPGALLGLAACCLLVAASLTPLAAIAATSGSASSAVSSGTHGDTPPSATLIGAGDICVTSRIADARATAKLIADEPDAHVFTLGDNSNEIGTAAQYADCYGATWGQFLDRTSASAGNHDYYADGAASYYQYFGKAAGPSGTGYYSYDVAGWHIIVLNAECGFVGGCGPGSPEDRWLVADLAAHPTACTLAYWHQPRFSSGAPGQATDIAYQWFWEDLYAYHADVVLNGHAHDYERFAPQTPSGKASEAGIREFVVGSGGAGQLPLGTPQSNSEVRHTGTLGVLKLTLHAASYDWQFIPVAADGFTDAGTGTCH